MKAMRAMLFLFCGAWLWTSGSYVHVPASPNWQNSCVAVVASGTSAQSPQSLTGTCNDVWAHAVLGSTYSCNLSGAGGWCRDVSIAVHNDVPGSATTCTLSMPGMTRTLNILITDGIPTECG